MIGNLIFFIVLVIIALYTMGKTSISDADYEKLLEEKKAREEEEQKRKKEEQKERISPIQHINEETDALKIMGDEYERFIGSKLEEKGELVIYNGFIFGHYDEGIDIISISLDHKVINLIQCKNWKNKDLTLNDVSEIYTQPLCTKST